MKVINICLILIIIIALNVIPGCSINSYPTYQSNQEEGNSWYAEIDNNKYILWPDRNWLLLNDETGEKIGYLDSKQTALYTVIGDNERNFIKVYEVGADVMHVPLVKENIAEEFSFNRIDAIEWSKWGIHAENLAELIGKDTITDKASIDRFVEYFDDLNEESIEAEWVPAGTIYCYNSNMPGIVYAVETEYSNGIIKCSGYNSYSYVLIPQSELESLLGSMPELD